MFLYYYIIVYIVLYFELIYLLFIINLFFIVNGSKNVYMLRESNSVERLVYLIRLILFIKLFNIYGL